MKRMIRKPKVMQALFFLQALISYAGGLGLLLMPDALGNNVHTSAMEGLLTLYCAAIMLAFGVGSSLAIRSKGWHEVKLLVQMQITLAGIVVLALVMTGFIHGVSPTLWACILGCAIVGAAWVKIYLTRIEEVKRPVINIKEF